MHLNDVPLTRGLRKSVNGNQDKLKYPLCGARAISNPIFRSNSTSADVAQRLKELKNLKKALAKDLDQGLWTSFNMQNPDTSILFAFIALYIKIFKLLGI